MGEFIVAHKLALLLIGAALGGFILLTRNKGAQAANGVPVNPYNASNPSDGGGGGFDLSSLLPSGPAGPALDPSAPAPAAPTAGETPAAIDNAPVDTSGVSTDPYAGSPTISYTPPQDTNGAPFPTYVIPADPSAGVAQAYFTPTNYFQNEQGYGIYSTPPPPDAVDRYLANQATRTPASASGTGTAPAVSLPVQPVDLTPRPTVGHAVAV